MRYLRFYFFLFLLFFCVFFVVTKSRNDYKKQTVVSVCKNEALNVKKFHGMVKPQFSSNLSFQSDGRIVYFPFSNGDFVKK